MEEDAFGDDLADRLDELLPHIEALGFKGEIVLTSHLGNFCLQVDDTGRYQLAAPEASYESCDYFGHVAENNDFVSERLSEKFSRLLQNQQGSDVALRLVALTAGDSQPQVDYPVAAATAGEWNAAARLNNRVAVTFAAGS